MPITPELDNSRRLKAVGFTVEQAETLTEIIEGAQRQGFERFSEVLERSFSAFRNEMNQRFGQLDSAFVQLDSKLDTVRAELRAELHSGLRDQMLKFIGIMAMMISLAVAIIKLFPNVQ
ncbi:MAG: hypothetical protein V3T00_01890 [bacterium]